MTKEKKKLQWWKRALIILSAVIFAIIAVVGGYVIYVFAQYYRINDNLELDVGGNRQNKISSGSYSALTFNIGFGAYDHDFDFFLDTGYDADGNEICGTHAKATSRENVIKNTNGAISVAKAATPDFLFVQEVDTNSDRSYHINQADSFISAFNDYSCTFAQNYHSANLLYPFNDPIGASNSGLLTLSKFEISTAIRRSLPLSDSIFDNLFDLDRCISINRLEIENSQKQLVLINVHMSAYDEGGKIRELQSKFLGSILSAEQALGNYVVVGGDFNQILAGDAQTFLKEGGELVPDWIAEWEEQYEGYEVVATTLGDGGNDIGTCRNNATAYNQDTVYTAVIDGFIVSDNLTVNSVINLTSHNFNYSDHNPVLLNFTI